MSPPAPALRHARMQAPVGNLSTRSCSGVSRAVLQVRKRHAVLYMVLRADAPASGMQCGRATRVAGPDDCYEQPVQMTPMRSRSPPVCRRKVGGVSL